MKMTKAKISTVDCNGNAIFIGSYVKRVRNFLNFKGKSGQYYKVIGINELSNISFNEFDSYYISKYFEVDNSVVVEGKEYRLAVFYKESPIVVACNNINFQQEFEESPGFVYWLTDWIEW